MPKRDAFFRKMERHGIEVTFKDVKLRTSHSEVMPDDVQLNSRFSRNIELKIPIVSAAMDTVTEHALATELAKLGGLGIIHRGMPPRIQAEHVARVKRHLNASTGLIEEPVCIFPSYSIEKVLDIRKKRGLHFSSFPVISREGTLVGILTGNDFDFCINPRSKVSEIMTPRDRLKSVPEGTNWQKAYDVMKGTRKKCLPVVNDQNELVGLYIYSDLKKIKTGETIGYNIDTNGRLVVGAAVGVGRNALKQLEFLVDSGVDVVVIDTAHADSKPVFDTLAQIKKEYHSLDVVVGNISEPDSAKALIDAGADGIKIGQGPGAICTTRIIAGVGRPQVSAINDCSVEAAKAGIPLCADGGLTYSGDIPIAIAAGADSVMMGSMLAGTKEAPGDIIYLEGRPWKSYRGMGSLEAMKQFQSSRERYRDTGKSGIVPEGVEGKVPYRGELALLMEQYVGGLRRGMGYVGARTIQELKANTNFVRITVAGQEESHPHSIRITSESPNYSR